MGELKGFKPQQDNVVYGFIHRAYNLARCGYEQTADQFIRTEVPQQLRHQVTLTVQKLIARDDAKNKREG